MNLRRLPHSLRQPAASVSSACSACRRACSSLVRAALVRRRRPSAASPPRIALAERIAHTDDALPIIARGASARAQLDFLALFNPEVIAAEPAVPPPRPHRGEIRNRTTLAAPLQRNPGRPRRRGAVHRRRTHVDPERPGRRARADGTRARDLQRDNTPVQWLNINVASYHGIYRAACRSR